MNTIEIVAKVRKRLSYNAREVLAAAGLDDGAIIEDIEDVDKGRADAVLAHCLDGAEGTNTIDGWTEYVDTLVYLMAPVMSLNAPPYVCTTDTAPPSNEDCRYPDRCNCDSCGDARRP